MSEPGESEAVVWEFAHKGGMPRSRILDAIEILNKSKATSSIFPLTALSVDDDEVIRNRVWSVLTDIVAKQQPESLASIDNRMRYFHVKIYNTYQNQLDKSTIPTEILGMMSFNFDGYQREFAVRELVERYDGRELPFLLMRVTDWVPAVRRLAAKAVDKRIGYKYADHFATYLPLLKRLREAQRLDHTKMCDDIEKMLSAPANTPALTKQLGAASSLTRRYALKLILKSEDNPSGSFLSEAFLNRDGMVRSIIAEEGLKRLKGKEADQLIDSMLKDPFGSIRKEALRWMVEHQRENWQEILADALFDRNGGIREFARYYLRDKNIAQIYVQNLHACEAPTRRIEATLHGIVETKVKVDLSAVRQFLTHSNCRVRATAYEILLRDDSTNRQQLILDALADTSGPCLRIARLYLAEDPYVVPPEELWNLIESQIPTRSKRIALSAIARLSKWDSLPYLLAMTALVEDHFSETMRDALYRWFNLYNSSNVRPNATQLQKCVASLSKFGNSLDLHRRNLLEFSLKGFSEANSK